MISVPILFALSPPPFSFCHAVVDLVWTSTSSKWLAFYRILTRSGRHIARIVHFVRHSDRLLSTGNLRLSRYCPGSRSVDLSKSASHCWDRFEIVDILNELADHPLNVPASLRIDIRPIYGCHVSLSAVNWTGVSENSNTRHFEHLIAFREDGEVRMSNFLACSILNI